MITVDEAAWRIRRGEGYVVDEHGCWITEERSSEGFGPFLAFYEASYGEVPEGAIVFHMCRGASAGCVRPSHLDIAPEGSRIAAVPDQRILPDERLEFAERIRQEREARGLTRAQFAKQLGVSATTLKGWEVGESAPTSSTFDDVARRMGWDGLVRRWVVVVAVERIEKAPSAGEAARQAIAALHRDGQPHKEKVVRCELRP